MNDLWKMSVETAVQNVEVYMRRLEDHLSGRGKLLPSEVEKERAMYGIATLKCVADYANYGNLDKYQDRENEYQELEKKKGANKSKYGCGYMGNSNS